MKEPGFYVAETVAFFVICAVILVACYWTVQGL